MLKVMIFIINGITLIAIYTQKARIAYKIEAMNKFLTFQKLISGETMLRKDCKTTITKSH